MEPQVIGPNLAEFAKEMDADEYDPGSKTPTVAPECPDCKGTGKVTLFTTIRTCRCRELEV